MRRMNLKRGLRRILLVLTSLCSLAIFTFTTNDQIQYREDQRSGYATAKIDFDAITKFWVAWDKLEYDQKIACIKYLLDNCYSKIDLYNVKLYPSDVFPWLKAEMLSMSFEKLEEEAQLAKEYALSKKSKYIQEREFWANQTKSSVILQSLLEGLLVASIAFLCIWIVFWYGGLLLCKFVRWIVIGFHDEVSTKSTITSVEEETVSMEKESQSRKQNKDSSVQVTSSLPRKPFVPIILLCIIWGILIFHTTFLSFIVSSDIERDPVLSRLLYRIHYGSSTYLSYEETLGENLIQAIVYLLGFNILALISLILSLLILIIRGRRNDKINKISKWSIYVSILMIILGSFVAFIPNLSQWPF